MIYCFALHRPVAVPGHCWMSLLEGSSSCFSHVFKEVSITEALPISVTTHKTTVRFQRIRHLFKKVKEFRHTQVQSINEVGRCKDTMAGNLWHFNKKKPYKFGYNRISRSSSDGIMHDIILYAGTNTLEHHWKPLPLQKQKLSTASMFWHMSTA